MHDYLKSKYERYNEFSICHIQSELLCSVEDANLIIKTVLKPPRIGKYFIMSFDDFALCVDTGIKHL